MEEWDQPHWSGRPQPKEETRPRLRPNAFARLARFCARNSTATILLVALAAIMAAGFAALTLSADPGRAPRITFDAQTKAAEAALDKDFPGIDETFVGRTEMADPDAAKSTALAVAQALAKRNELFSGAFVPGTGPFYDEYGFLFRKSSDIDARVDQALRMQPLFQALSASPNIAGLAALANEINRAIAEGQSPPGLTGLLLAASASIEGEIEGKPKPIDWPALAGLSSAEGSRLWFVMATPQPGHEREAATFAMQATSKLPGIIWYLPPAAYPGASDLLRDMLVPLAVALLMTLIILGAGLGHVKYVVPVVGAVLASLGLTSGVAALVTPVLDGASWPFGAAAAAPAFLFSLIFVLAQIETRMRGSETLAAIMLVAQRRGLLLVGLAGIAEAFWLTWLTRQLPSMASLAIVASVAILLALLITLTLVPALLASFDGDEELHLHWLDAAVIRGAGSNLRNGLQVLMLVLTAASAFSAAVFVPALRFGETADHLQQAPLDSPVALGAVHFLREPEAPTRRLVDDLAKLPEKGAIRAVEQFLPADTDDKRRSLSQLEGFMPGATISGEAPADTDMGAAFTRLEDGLRQITDNPATAPDLSEAAHRLRRAVGLFINPSLPERDRVMSLEHSLFGGLTSLPIVAAKLSLLDTPQLSDLDPGLRSRFVGADGTWRVEVLPKPGVSRLSFAAAMRRLDPKAAGGPIAELARSEIMHHESALAAAIAYSAAALMMLLIIRNVLDWVLALIPTGFAIGLSAAAMVGSGTLVSSPALAAGMTAIAMSLSASVILVLSARQASSSSKAPGTGFRAAILPPIALAGALAPLAISTDAGVAEFGKVSALFELTAVAVAAIAVPQLWAWAEALRRR